MIEKGKDEVLADLKTLKNFMQDVMLGCGVPAEQAETVADVLIASDRRGIDSHGIARLIMYYQRLKRKQIEPVTRMTVEKEAAAIARLNANNGMGHPAAKYAMEMAVEKAKSCGIGMTVVNNSNHFGIAGYYTLMAADEGCIGICGTNTRPNVAPTYAVQPLLGTNPLTITVPTDWPFHWCADQATSIIQRGKVETYARLGKPLFPGWVIDEEGKPATDAAKVLQDIDADKAALMPIGGSGEEMGGYKGYNYSTLVEILSACLSQANFLGATLGISKDGKRVPFNLGHFFIAVDVEAFLPLDAFKKYTGDMLRELAGARKAKGADHIYIAGEKEWLAEKKRKKEGVPITLTTQRDMLLMQKELCLNNYKFKFNANLNAKEVGNW